MSKVIANFKQFQEMMPNLPKKMRPVIAFNLYIIKDNYGEMPDGPFEANVDGGAVIIYDDIKDLKKFNKINFFEAIHEYDTESKKFDCIMSLILSSNDFGTVFITERKNLDDFKNEVTKDIEDEDSKEYYDPDCEEVSSVQAYENAWKRFQTEFGYKD